MLKQTIETRGEFLMMPSYNAGALHVRPDNIVAWREDEDHTKVWRNGIATPDKVTVSGEQIEAALAGCHG